MRSSSVAAVAIVLILSILVAAPGGAQVPEDLKRLMPADLAGQDLTTLNDRARAAYAEGRWADSARAWAKLLRQRPGNPIALYNLACCFGLMGDADQAARFLVAAWQAGFADLATIDRDTDFDRVRGSESFRDARARLAVAEGEQRRRSGALLDVVAPVEATVRVVAPATVPAGTKLPLVVGLHGAAGNAEGFARLFSDLGVATPFVYCVPQAPVPAAGDGWLWYRADGGNGRVPLPQSRRLTEEYVLAAIDAALAAYPVDPERVYLLGFSQGGFMAFSLGLKHPERFRGVVPVGGWLNPGDFTPGQLAKAKVAGRFLICHSDEDQAIAPAEGRAASEFLAANEITHVLHRYPGGHLLTPDLLRHIAGWIAAR